MRPSKLIALALAATSLAGCSLAPVYHQPAVPTAASFKEVPGWQPAGTAVPPAGKWWQAFDDPTLSALEDRIEGANPSLAAAAARYAQARAQARVARADLFPEVDAQAGYGRSRESANRPFSPGTTQTFNDAAVGASLSYELDLFGRIANSVRAATAEAHASGSDLAAVRLGLQAQLATSYFDMRGLDARIVLLRQTVDAFGRASALTNDRHQGGVASGIDVSRADAQLASARSELDAVLADRANLEHAIAILLGESPSSFALAVADTNLAPPAIPAGLPSTLLERRPDIAAAERRVYAANARIGVARAAFFPTISLGAAGGYEATQGHNLLSASSGFWALGPIGAALTLFDGGARSAQVKISRAQFDEAAANYRSTVLTAFREVEDDIALGRQLAAQEQDQQHAVTAAERTRDLALIRYRDGASDYLEVVTAQTAALDAERTLLQIHARRLDVAADLVRALGGAF
ncbi:MAG TPA: efflux transporter outer membrane subunit [Sphingomonas sp.]|uniref:efflux transporter outer membrane subunit n=1 Tax=Sphingomonas sp. TaxID=28214 RepID=UPI002C97AD4D|nr:efflux transporter outer membrane subunit [Sphingomonas sp.]HMI18270.1 efflux transporter outer membrane subunit [Sphingomonas sp.]